MARLDRLGPAKQVAQLGAVVGREFSYEVIQAVVAGGGGDAAQGLAQLVDAELLYQRGLPPQARYTFRHVLIQEAAYQSLPRKTRRQYHQQLLQVLEERFPEIRELHPELLARHALSGEVWEKAVVYWRQAGARAFMRSANREAVVCFEQALAALRCLPENRDLCEQAIDLRFDLRNALLPLGEYARGLDRLHEAATLAEALGDQRRLAYASSCLCSLFRIMGDYPRALEIGQRALAIAEALGDVRVQIEAHHNLGVAYFTLGHYRRAMDVFRWNMAAFDVERLREGASMTGKAASSSPSWLVLCLAELGVFAEGVTIGEAAVRMAEASEHPLSCVRAYNGLGILYLRKGDLQAALSVLERGVALCRSWSLWDWFPSLASALGYVYALAGRLSEAVPLLEQALEQDMERRRGHPHVFRVAGLSEVYLLAGRTEDAVPLASRACHLAHERQERGNQAWVLRLLGELHVQRAPLEVETAEAFYQQALDLGNEHGMRPLLAHVHLGLGKLNFKTGRRDQAYAELTAAIALYRSMDMRYWLPQAEFLLAQVEIR